MAWAEAYLRTKWHLDQSSHLATTDMGRKLEGVPFGGGAGRSPSNTMWPGPRPTCMPSFILIHPTVWPQYTNTDRTDRQRSYSIGRTGLQTVAQTEGFRLRCDYVRGGGMSYLPHSYMGRGDRTTVFLLSRNASTTCSAVISDRQCRDCRCNR